jgi:hypothetical protein
MVFLGSSFPEKRPKNAIKKSMGKDDRKKKSQLFRPKVFDMDFPQKVFNGVFELPLLRKKISKLKKKKYLPTPFSGHLPDIRRFHFFSLDAPCQRQQPMPSSRSFCDGAIYMRFGGGKGAPTRPKWAVLSPYWFLDTRWVPGFLDTRGPREVREEPEARGSHGRRCHGPVPC